MLIQQCKQFKHEEKNFYPIYPIFQYNISFISTFLVLDYGHIRQNLEYEIKYHFIDRPGLGFQTAEVSVDNENDLVYIGVMPDPCDYEDKDYPFIDEKTSLEHFQEGILESVHLKKDNFFRILRIWKKYLEEKPPFLLLYQDENDSFDILPFQSKEKMDQFVKDHTPIVN
jgi:hypothetical protein